MPRPLRPRSAGRDYDLVLSTGIGGGFAPMGIGDIAVASTIVFADLGAESPDGFLPLDLGRRRRYPVEPKLAVELADRSGGRLGTIVTVATVTGTAQTADDLLERYPDAVAEAMEGAGVAAAARVHGVAFGEIRAISNPVGPRDRDAWRIPEALDALGRALAAVLRMKIAYSPCPNDTFVFHAWAHGLLAGAPELDVTFADIDITNSAVERGEFDVAKVSYAALPWLLDQYALLPSGGALGRGCGPLVLTRDPLESVDGRTVAVPSERSTAYLLFRLWAAGQRPARIEVVPFASIMPAVRDGQYDAGLVIHEARFTYPSYGLSSLVDLGAWWESDTGLPIPLGAILARRSLDVAALAGFARASVEYAWAHPDASAELRGRARRRDGPGRPAPAHRRSTSTSSPAITRRRGLRRRGRATHPRLRRGPHALEPAIEVTLGDAMRRRVS